MAERNQRRVKGMIIKDTLGKGTFGFVKLGIKEDTGAKFALKFLKRDVKTFKEKEVKKEIDCMKAIRHKNVVALLASSMKCKYPREDGSFDMCVLMVMELANGGDLYDVIYYSGAMSEKLGRTYFMQLMDGLEACHNAGITHRDLKPNNILIDSEYVLKITDFGLSHIGPSEVEPSEKRMNTTWVGTKGYRAPELVLGRHYSNQCDVFALGVCLFVMLCARQPFKTASAKDPWYRRIAGKDFAKYWSSHKSSNLTKPCREFIQELLCYQPRERIKIADARNHAWMKEETFQKSELKEQMRIAHEAACKKKMKDPERQKRLANSEAGGKKRGVAEDPLYTNLEVEKINLLPRFWACWEILPEGQGPEDLEVARSQNRSAALVLQNAIETRQVLLKASGDDIQVSEKTMEASMTVKVVDTICEEVQVVLRFGVVNYEGKDLFFVKATSEVVFLGHQCTNLILDGVHQYLVQEPFKTEGEQVEKGMTLSQLKEIKFDWDETAATT